MSLEGYYGKKKKKLKLKKREKENKNKHEVSVKIDGDAWKKALDRVFNKKQKTVSVDGFRKGKVPRNVYEKNLVKNHYI